MSSIKEMKRNFFIGLLMATMVYLAIVVALEYFIKNIKKKEDQIPELLILPPPVEEDFPLDLHPPIELKPLMHDNVA